MSLKIRFVRLEKSQLVKEAIEDRLLPTIQKFDFINEEDIFFEVEMENSPHQAGRDLFRVKIVFRSGEMQGFVLEKTDDNFYRALSSLSTSLPVNINRYRQKQMTKRLNKQRRVKNVSNF